VCLIVSFLLGGSGSGGDSGGDSGSGSGSSKPPGEEALQS